MPAIPPKVSDVFGYHFNFPLKKGHKGEIYTKRAVNVLNPLSYIPVIGTIVGASRIYFFNKYLRKNSGERSMGKKTTNDHKAFFKAEIIRGAFELTSLGLTGLKGSHY